jgi:hypothetical protein
MWFEDEEMLGCRLMGKHKKRKKPVLKVNVRLDVQSKMARQKFAAFILLPFVCVAVVFVLWFVFGTGKKVLFTENSLFALRNLEIVVDPDGEVTPQLIRGYAQLTPGMNIFDIDVQKIRSTFLQDMHNVKVMELRRQLPNTLRIKVIEREPIARIGRTGILVADTDGHVFVKKADLDRMPVVYGSKGVRLRPGSRAEGMTYAAIQTLDICNDPRFEAIKIQAIDVSGSEDITLWLSGNKVAVLAWEKMGEEVEVSRRALYVRLKDFSRTLESDRGRKQTKFNLTFDNKIITE